MLASVGRGILIVLCGALFTACAQHRPLGQGHAASLDSTTIDGADGRQILAGEWEYEDGAVVTLRLDEEGNGTHAWKNGRLMTTEFNDHTWTGVWLQSDNDREGGFEVILSPDYTEGECRWWYTRIGSDETPTGRGGTFRLVRISTQARIE